MLFNRHAHLVFGVCMKYLKNEAEAKDATLDIFETLITKLRDQKIQRFPAWLHTVSRNHCLMILRKQKSNGLEVDLSGLEESADHSEETILRETKLDVLEKTIEHLKPEQQQCVKAFYLEKQSYQQIADRFGFSAKEVKSHIQNGKRNLKIQLEQHHAFRS